MNQRCHILDYNIVSGSIVECVEEIAGTIATSNEPHWFACLNPHSYAVAKEDPLFTKALHDADWLVPDGAGVVMASRYLKCPVHERITGSDIFYGLHEHLERQGGGKIFFLGSTEEILWEIGQNMALDYSNLEVVGTFSPPYKSEFSDVEMDEMVTAINAVKPDVLWVGMTAPKQEKWIYQNRRRLKVKFIGAIGAVFDFYTGHVERSHPVFQSIGLEWLPRLLHEPRRLWRRMGVSAPLFVWDVLRWKWRRWIDKVKRV